MELEFREGDRVRLTREGVIFYGGAWPNWVPQEQGGGAEGTILFAGERPHRPGAAPRPYYVRWDNGVQNSYRVQDLERASGQVPEPEPEPESDPEPEEPDSNIVPFNRRPS